MAEALRNEKGHWLPGQSGNLKGAPVGLRELTRKLQEKLLAEVEIKWKDIKTLPTALFKLDNEGKCKISAGDFLTTQITNLILNRKLVFPDGEEWIVPPNVYWDIVKWIYAQIDGAPVSRQEIDVKGIHVNWDLFADTRTTTSGIAVQPVQPDTETAGSLPETT